MWSPLRATLVLIVVFIGLPVAIFFATPRFMDYAACKTQVTEFPYPAELRRGTKPPDFDVSVSRKACKVGDGSSIRYITHVSLRQTSAMTLGFSKAKPDITVDTFFEFHGPGAVTPQWTDSRILLIEHDVDSERISRQAIIWSDVKIEYRRKD